MNKITVQQVSKAYQAGEPVLKNLSFEAHACSITAILGPSGGGKSTLLRLLCQLEPIDAGSIHLFNKKVGMIFQQFHLWKHMTALENCILAPVQVLKMNKKEAITQVIAWFKKLGIEQKQDCYPANLSGGEQQRVAIIRALMMNPEVLLFDEPTAALDPERTQGVSQIIQSLANKNRIIIVVTHDVEFAKQVANQVLFLEKGEIVEQLPIQNQTITPKTKRFLNYLNQASQSILSYPHEEYAA